jgi:hypothetical protein
VSPIRASERARYPADWPAISLRIRDRSGGRCECDGRCGHDHHAETRTATSRAELAVQMEPLFLESTG